MYSSALCQILHKAVGKSQTILLQSTACGSICTSRATERTKGSWGKILCVKRAKSLQLI